MAMNHLHTYKQANGNTVTVRLIRERKTDTCIGCAFDSSAIDCANMVSSHCAGHIWAIVSITKGTTKHESHSI